MADMKLWKKSGLMSNVGRVPNPAQEMIVNVLLRSQASSSWRCAHSVQLGPAVLQLVNWGTNQPYKCDRTFVVRALKSIAKLKT